MEVLGGPSGRVVGLLLANMPGRGPDVVGEQEQAPMRCLVLDGVGAYRGVGPEENLASASRKGWAVPDIVRDARLMRLASTAGAGLLGLRKDFVEASWCPYRACSDAEQEPSLVILPGSKEANPFLPERIEVEDSWPPMFVQAKVILDHGSGARYIQRHLVVDLESAFHCGGGGGSEAE